MICFHSIIDKLAAMKSGKCVVIILIFVCCEIFHGHMTVVGEEGEGEGGQVDANIYIID